MAAPALVIVAFVSLGVVLATVVPRDVLIGLWLALGAGEFLYRRHYGIEKPFLWRDLIGRKPR